MNSLGSFTSFAPSAGNPSELEKNQILEAHEKAFEIEVAAHLLTPDLWAP